MAKDYENGMPQESSDIQKVQKVVAEQGGIGSQAQGQTGQSGMNTPSAQTQPVSAQPQSQGQSQPQSQGQSQPQSQGQSQPLSQPNASYTDPSGNKYDGYVYNGTTYTDAAGTTPVAVGSTVTLNDGRQYYKGENGSVQIGTGEGMVTPVNYTDAAGQNQRGYVINGVTYTDPYGKNPIAVGSTVTLPDGTQWYKGENGSVQLSTEKTTERDLHDLSYLINQQYDAAQQAAQQQINYGTQQSMDQLMRAMRDAQPQYEDAIANQLLETRQAQDAQAMRNQLNGDRGGIGSAQVDSIGNTGAKNREAIAQQQRQLASDTARQIADLRAQGKYAEAQSLLQVAQQRLSALYNEQVRLQQEQTVKENQQIQIDQNRQSNLATLAKTLLNAGIMPSGEMLDALGLDSSLAQAWLDKVNGTGSGSGSGGGGGTRIIRDDDKGNKIMTYNDLSENAKNIISRFDEVRSSIDHQNSNKEIIADAINAGKITLAEAVFLGNSVDLSNTEAGWKSFADSLK